MVRAFLGLVAVALLAACPASAANKLFGDPGPLHITITGPFKAMVAGAKYSLKPYPATLTLTDPSGANQNFTIQMRPRGISRRKVYCAFPPIMLTFDKEGVHGTLFHGQSHLKLVTYCHTPPDYEQRVMLEYLIYKLYNLITPMSLRVRSAEVTYRDSPGEPGVTRFGYLIEDMHSVAGRNDREELKGPSHMVALSQLDAHATTRAAVLEYMIGNLDWDFVASASGEVCCHNMRLLAAPDAKPATARDVVPVPYDFDFSGFVDSPYAGVPEGIPLERITQRYFRGHCAMSGEVPAVAREYLARRADMTALIDNQPGLDSKFKDKTERFMDEFFAALNDPGRLQSQLVRHCR
jgi:hypothetical protein